MRRRNGSGLTAGIILIAFGLLLLGDNLDILYHVSPDFYYPSFRLFSWPVIFLVIGAIVLANDSRSVFGWIMVTLGGLNVAGRFFHFSVGNVISDFWPLILIVIGLVLLLKRRDHHTLHFSNSRCGNSNEFKDEFKKEFKGVGEEIKNEFRKEFHGSDEYSTDSADTIEVVSIFNSIKRRVTSNSFRGGKVTSIFGGSEIYLTESNLAEGEHVLDIAAIFGGIDLYVPKNWRVIVKTTAIFGGFDDSRFYQADKTMETDRALVIKGFVLFGGGDVKN